MLRKSNSDLVAYKFFPVFACQPANQHSGNRLIYWGLPGGCSRRKLWQHRCLCKCWMAIVRRAGHQDLVQVFRLDEQVGCVNWL